MKNDRPSIDRYCCWWPFVVCLLSVTFCINSKRKHAVRVISVCVCVCLCYFIRTATTLSTFNKGKCTCIWFSRTLAFDFCIHTYGCVRLHSFSWAFAAKNLFGNCQFGFYLICCVHRWLPFWLSFSLSRSPFGQRYSRDTIILVKQTHTHNNAMPIHFTGSGKIIKPDQAHTPNFCCSFLFSFNFLGEQREPSICYVAFKHCADCGIAVDFDAKVCN